MNPQEKAIADKLLADVQNVVWKDDLRIINDRIEAYGQFLRCVEKRRELDAAPKPSLWQRLFA